MFLLNRIRPQGRISCRKARSSGVMAVPEARTAEGEFVHLDEVVLPAEHLALPDVLEALVAGLQARVGGTLGDDLALLLAEFRTG